MVCGKQQHIFLIDGFQAYLVKDSILSFRRKTGSHQTGPKGSREGIFAVFLAESLAPPDIVDISVIFLRQNFVILTFCKAFPIPLKIA